MLNMNPLQAVSFWPMVVLIFEFHLSGLWILSLIFTTPSIQQLQYTNLFMFIALGVCSLVGGYASDIIGRTTIFKVGSAVWVVGAMLALFNARVGYIITAGCIGLLNNLTFVLIMQLFKNRKDIYTIYVLMGWASSQIVLGVLFYFIKNNDMFFLLLFILTVVYAVAAFLFIEQPNSENNNINSNLAQQYNQDNYIDNNNLLSRNNHNHQNNSNEQRWYKKILPHSLKPLIGGCILMFVMQMFYYRTQFTLDRFGISLQLNTIVVGLTQLSANIIFTRLINKFPRKMYIRIFLIILSILFIILIIVHNKIVQTLIQGIMRLFDTCIMIILGVYLPQLFNKDERGKGTNYVMSFGILGSALNNIILNGLQFWQLIFFIFAGFVSTFCFKEVYPQDINKNQNSQNININEQYN